MPSIEGVWSAMRAHGFAAQRRLDAAHPRDLYADFNPPDEVGLVAICSERPTLPRSLKAMTIETGQREDGRWSLRLALHESALQPVFAALCNDIMKATFTGVDAAQLGGAVIARLQRWRSLLERDAAGLDEHTLRGLIGELVVLLGRVLPELGPRAAVRAWQGPRGAAQDFLLPDGRRIEVKSANWDAGDIQINGLQQLDPGPDTLTLAVVRMQKTGPAAVAVTTAPRLIGRVRAILADEADALADFDDSLAVLGWHEHPSHEEFGVRIVSVEAHPVAFGFPRLTTACVPVGVVEVTYRVILPGEGVEPWTWVDE